MAQFPMREAEILALAQNMVSGLTAAAGEIAGLASPNAG